VQYYVWCAQNDVYYYYYYDDDMPPPKHKSKRQLLKPTEDDVESMLTSLKRALRRPGVPRPRPPLTSTAARNKQQTKVKHK